MIVNLFPAMFVGLSGITVPQILSAANGQSNRNCRKASFSRSGHASLARGTAELGRQQSNCVG